MSDQPTRHPMTLKRIIRDLDSMRRVEITHDVKYYDDLKLDVYHPGSSSAVLPPTVMSLDPDVCILNHYDHEGRMGLHQDKDEGPQSIAAGWPVVSVSIGDTARFLFGGLRRRDPVETIPLQSGDAFVFGGAARLRFHGVSRIIPGTAPPELAMTGRFNLTFRQSDGSHPIG